MQDNNQQQETVAGESAPNQVENNKEVVATLNKVLKGEHMAIDTYDQYLDRIDDSQTKDLLQQFKEDHQKHASKLAQRIEDLGADPQENSGLSGLVSQTMMEIGDLLGMEPSEEEAVNKIYQGEDMGINLVEENLIEKLDKKSKDLVSEVLETDKQHLEQFKQFSDQNVESQQ